jgi:hypothetical protein
MTRLMYRVGLRTLTPRPTPSEPSARPPRRGAAPPGAARVVSRPVPFFQRHIDYSTVDVEPSVCTHGFSESDLTQHLFSRGRGLEAFRGTTRSSRSIALGPRSALGLADSRATRMMSSKREHAVRVCSLLFTLHNVAMPSSVRIACASVALGHRPSLLACMLLRRVLKC